MLGYSRLVFYMGSLWHESSMDTREYLFSRYFPLINGTTTFCTYFFNYMVNTTSKQKFKRNKQEYSRLKVSIFQEEEMLDLKTYIAFRINKVKSKDPTTIIIGDF